MNKYKAFTVVELLTSIAIIALLIGILLPSITMVRRQAKEAAQKAQFNAIDMALDSFKQDYGDYPESFATPPPVYCGAQKLTEALLGWDLMGFHPKTLWAANGGGVYAVPVTDANLYDRRGTYLEVAKTPVFRLGMSAGKNDGLYNLAGFPMFDATLPNYVICDVFGVKKITITKTSGEIVSTMAGTPVLYYKANTNSKSFFCLGQTQNSIYNLYDNYALLSLRVLPDATKEHKLYAVPPLGTYFCDPQYKIIDQKVYSASGMTKFWPNRPDTYILISAGADHEFGTSDDILNF